MLWGIGKIERGLKSLSLRSRTKNEEVYYLKPIKFNQTNCILDVLSGKLITYIIIISCIRTLRGILNYTL